MADATAAIAGTTPLCGHCGAIHSGPCPRIKAIEYHPNGAIKRVEYHAPRDQITINPDGWNPPAAIR